MKSRQRHSKFLTLLAAAGLAAPATVLAAPPPVNKESDKLVTQGDVLRQQGQMVEALQAYRQAAKAGNAKGAFAAGQMLCQAALDSHGRERILDLPEGLADLLQAATNQLPQACAELSGRMQNGAGVPTNQIAAYAWMKLAAEQNRDYLTDLDRLAVLMNPEDILEGQALAHEYTQGHWPGELAQPVDEGDPRLKIKGITVGARARMVVINRVTFSQGDTLEVSPEKTPQHPSVGTLTVTCLEIGGDYVLVSVEGESHLKLLTSGKLMP